MTDVNNLTPEEIEALTLNVQPVLIGGRFGFEYVSAEIARYLVGEGVARTLTASGRALIAEETEKCKRCGHPVVYVDRQDNYVHSTPDGVPLPSGRGCRSASFSRDNDWDDSLDRSWSATV